MDSREVAWVDDGPSFSVPEGWSWVFATRFRTLTGSGSPSCCPTNRGSTGAEDNRQFLDSVLWIARTGAVWWDLLEVLVVGHGGPLRTVRVGEGVCGLDEYEVWSWTGWHQPVTLSLFALAGVVVIRSWVPTHRKCLSGIGARNFMTW